MKSIKLLPTLGAVILPATKTPLVAFARPAPKSLSSVTFPPKSVESPVDAIVTKSISAVKAPGS